MSDLEDLYKQVILDHYRNPRNKGDLPVPPAFRSDGYNPLCGDEITLYLEVGESELRQVRLQARGCSISVAAASMMSGAVKGKDVGSVRKLIQQFRDMMHAHADDLDEGRDVDADTIGSQMGDLEALRGVVRFPVRIKCATLPWVTLEQGLDDAESGGDGHEPATTEEPAE